MATAILACALAASALLLLAAWCDLATRTIPDSISVALALLGLLTRAAEGLAPVAVSLLVAAVLFAAFLPLHARGAFGGGDIKLITALAVGFAGSMVCSLGTTWAPAMTMRTVYGLSPARFSFVLQLT